MKKLRVKVCCSAYYEPTMEVPDNLDFNEAITYAQKNLQNIPVHELIFDGDEEIDWYSSNFVE